MTKNQPDIFLFCPNCRKEIEDDVNYCPDCEKELAYAFQADLEKFRQRHPDPRIAELQLLLQRIGGLVFTTLNMFEIPDYETMKKDIETIDKIIKNNQQLINSK